MEQDNDNENGHQMTTEECKGFLGKSPLLELDDFDFIDNITCEYMHSVCLGVVKRQTQLTFKVGEPRPRVTKRKLSDPALFNEQIRNISLPGECSRRCRNLDFSVLKASEFRNLILFFFPIVVQIIGSEHSVEQNIWLDLAFLVRACVLPDAEFNLIDKQLLNRICANYYKNYEKMYGHQNCTYSTHIVGSHLMQIRGPSPLNSRSAFKYESFYSEMKDLFCPGTPSPTKQILKNCYMKRQLENHRCQRKITYKSPPSKKTMENNSSIYVLAGSGHKLYNIVNVNEDNTFTCYEQGKFNATFNDTIKRNWCDVGVYKLGPIDNVPITIKKKDIAGKVLTVNGYLITCPNHVLTEQ